MSKKALKELQQIPGVGPRLSEALFNLGISSIEDLRDNDPEKLYKKMEKSSGHHVDRCVLYVFRCAVYYASNDEHNPHLLKWWNWKEV